MRFQYRLIEDWPPLAWLARCPAAADAVEVFHGGRVEVGPEWFCEAVWAGEFESGDFDRTDIVFGSGARVREGAVVFVSAGSTLDRLHSIRVDDSAWVSNSLPCLLAALDAELDPAYPRYLLDFRSICAGLGLYKNTLETSTGPVRLTYFHNLCWDGTELRVLEKPSPPRDFNSYSRYRAFLEGMLRELSMNMSAADRRFRYEMLGTMSSGYDSPAVAVLARPFGLHETFAFKDTWRGLEDSGREVAELLGLELTLVDRGVWKSEELAVVPFLAADANGGDVDFAAAEPLLSGRVLLTGHMGYVVWSKRATGPNDHNLARKDHAGLSLSEYRLWAGFIHVPVPVMGVRQAGDIHAITRSPEMAPWDVAGNYNRPIPRRIVEEAGVPRHEFAVIKKGVSLQLSDPHIFWSAGFVRSYTRWLRERKRLWLREGRVPPPLLSRLARPWQRLALSISELLALMGGRRMRRSRMRRALRFFGSREYLYKFLFPWAIEHAKRRYASTLNGVLTSPGRAGRDIQPRRQISQPTGTKL